MSLPQNPTPDVVMSNEDTLDSKYSKLKTITLAEIVGPEAVALVVGTGDGTRVLIDDVTD